MKITYEQWTDLSHHAALDAGVRQALAQGATVEVTDDDTGKVVGRVLVTPTGALVMGQQRTQVTISDGSFTGGVVRNAWAWGVRKDGDDVLVLLEGDDRPPQDRDGHIMRRLGGNREWTLRLEGDLLRLVGLSAWPP